MNPFVSFVFQNSNGVFYDVTFNRATGAGIGVKHGLTYKSVPMLSAARTTVTVDGGSLAAWKNYHNSRRIVAAVYNTGQTLNAVLNAAS